MIITLVKKYLYLRVATMPKRAKRLVGVEEQVKLSHDLSHSDIQTKKIIQNTRFGLRRPAIRRGLVGYRSGCLMFIKTLQYIYRSNRRH